MPWPLRFRSEPEPWKDAQIGDCWYMPEIARSFFIEHQASQQYRHQLATAKLMGQDFRPPIVVRLPPGFSFFPDEKYGHPENDQRNGWTVSGSIEDGSLVVSPSVNVVGTYHGWIQAGQVSDDVEGRQFK
jgi:hypothetical protein